MSLVDDGKKKKANNLTLQKLKDFISKEATFFRIHLIAFTFVPLICSGIFYACNGRFRISYLDSLFLCYSAMTVTGLSTVNLSTVTPWQQVMLYLLMLIGDMTMVAWVMVLVRKEYFKRRCEFEYVKRKRISRSNGIFESISRPVAVYKSQEPVPPRENEGNAATDIPGMNFIGPTPAVTMWDSTISTNALGLHDDSTNQMQKHMRLSGEHEQGVLSDEPVFHSSPEAVSLHLSPVRSRPSIGQRGVDFHYTTSVTPSVAHRRRLGTIREGVPMPHRTATILTNRTMGSTRNANQHKYQGLGGFPGPIELAQMAAKRFAPKTYRKMERKLTMPYTTTLEKNRTPWLNFDLIVGRNSDFHTETLTDAQLEKIGGTEYIALRYLSYLVPASSTLGMLPFQQAYLMIISMMFVILAGNHALRTAYLVSQYSIFSVSRSHGATILREVCGSLSGLGRGLLEKVLRQRKHLAFSSIIHADASFTFSQVIKPGSSSSVWLYSVEWILFEVLNIGLEAYESLTIGPRIICGLFQGLAARASGFSIVPLASLAPALQFLYVVMMYIAIYPIAISIRSTNTYEEQSLGVFEQPPEDEDEEPQAQDLKDLAVGQRVHRYLGWHLKKQMSVDIWWLVWGVFIVTIIERNNLLDPDKKWFDLFRVLFELVSAFGGIGLSLGVPYDNFSFVGAMRPLSKLVVIVIMVRGRHRGLPVAVDRAVMLPHELMQQRERRAKEERARTAGQMQNGFPA
uniref:Putative potassium transporter n=1 Tax=Moniliophthora roreri TaxID=221103 RepID=A0A0W0GBM9_MONRR